MQSTHSVIRSFVRREGRFTQAQQAAVKNFWSVYGVEPHDKTLSFEAIFENNAPVILDIGFGNGEALACIAENHPKINFLGVEVYRPGIGALLKKITAAELKNIRIVNMDVVELLKKNIAAQCFTSILIWFPDPWPKKRHHKRRLIQPSFVDLIASKLTINGELNIATDWQPYAEHIQQVLKQNISFKESNCSKIIEQRPQTKFERRGEKLGHQVFEQIYKLNL